MDKSVVKAFMLLETLSESEEPLGVTALADRSDLGKSNVHRLLQTLIELGYVKQNDAAAYEPTLRTWELGSQVISRISVRDAARPYMQMLSRMTKEAVHLSERDGVEVLYIDKIESREPVRAYTQLGGRAPVHCTATGKAMLAFMHEDDIDEYMTEAKSFTSKTITDLERFRVEAEQIRARRFSLNRGEWRADIIGLAAPIADQTGDVVAALGLSAPAARVELSEFEALSGRIIEYAKAISSSLGCTPAQWEDLADAPARLPRPDIPNLDTPNRTSRAQTSQVRT